MEVIKVILVEDDKNTCDKFRKIGNKRSDIDFVKITDSDIEALEIVKNKKIDVVILDLELNKGSGNSDGFSFIEELKKLNLINSLRIIVTTNVMSDSVYDYLHENGVDFIFYKKQENYSEENVINKIAILSGYKSKSNNNLGIPKSETENVNEKIEKEINKELDLIGIPIQMKGRAFLFEAIKFIIVDGDKTDITITKHLFKVFKIPESTINRDMDNAIKKAWCTSSLDDLERLYTMKIDYRRGVPTTGEFIYYYARKIKDNL